VVRVFLQALDNVFGDGHESLVDVDVQLRRGFKELDFVFVRQGSTLLCGHFLYKSIKITSITAITTTPAFTHSLSRVDIALVSNQHTIHILRRILIDLSHPIADVVERVLVGHVVDEQNAHGSSVVGCGNRAESLLSGRIPYLKLHLCIATHDRLDLEVNTDSCDEGGGEGVVRVSKQQTGLAHARVSDQQQLDQVVVFRGSRIAACAIGAHGLFLKEAEQIR
jgi:hypothetical protein